MLYRLLCRISHDAHACQRAGCAKQFAHRTGHGLRDRWAACCCVVFATSDAYPWGDRAVVGRLIDRAKAARYKVMVATVDSLTAGKRKRDIRNNFPHELRLSAKVVLDGLTHLDWLLTTWIAGDGMPRFENVAEFVGLPATATDLAEFTRCQRNPSVKWDDILWIKERRDGTLLVKGISGPGDVTCAREIKLDGIVVPITGGGNWIARPECLTYCQKLLRPQEKPCPC